MPKTLGPHAGGPGKGRGLWAQTPIIPEPVSATVYSGSAAFAGAGGLFANDRFSPGKYDETGEVASLSLPADFLTELEYGLDLDLDTLAQGDVLRFRVYVNGVALDVYSATPTITIPAHAFNAFTLFAGVGRLSAAGTIPQPATTVTLAGTGALVAASSLFSAGRYDETGEAASMSFSGNAFTEIEFGLKLDLDSLSSGDTLRFRVYVNGVALDIYSITPVITIAAHAITALAAFAGTGNLSATGRLRLPALASFIGAGNLSVLATQRLVASAAFAGAGTFSQSAIRVAPAIATFSGAGNLSAIGALILNVPAPSLSDSFNRANGSLGSNWTNSPNLGTLSISSNAVVASSPGNHSAAYWSANSFPSDHFAQAVIGGTAGIEGAGVIVRHQVGSSSFYMFIGNTHEGATGWIFRCDSGSFVQLGANGFVSSLTQGDVLKLRVAGSILTASVNGIDVASRTDATYVGGYPGLEIFSATLDDFVAGPASFFVGTGSLAASASIAVGGNIFSGSAVFNCTGGMSAVASLRMAASAAFSGAGNFSVDAIRITPAVATFNGTGNLSALASLSCAVTASFGGASNLSALALLRFNAAATFAGIGNLASDAIRVIPAIATFNGAGSLSTLAQLILPVSANFAAIGNLSATAQLRSPVSVTFSGIGNLSASGQLRMVAVATFNGLGNLDAFATIAGAVNTYAGSALLTGTGNLSATAKLTLTASATYAGTGSLAALASQRMAASVLLNGLGAFSANSIKFIGAAATFNGTGSLTASATLVLGAAATFAGTGNFAISAALRLPALATFAGIGSLTGDLTSPLNVFAGTALLAGAGNLNVAAQLLRMVAFASLSGAGDLNVSARQRLLATAAFAGLGDLNINAGLRKPIAASFAGTGAFVASAIRVINNAATFAGTGLLAASASPLRGASALFAGTGNLNAAADKRTFIAALFTGSGTISVGTIHKMVATALFAGDGRLEAQSSLQVSADNIIKMVRVGITHNAPRTTVTIKATAHQVGVIGKVRPSVLVDWPNKRVA